jgi:xanthine/CO dehydrogenase XdhC/CoxF family maturation factor
MKEIKSIINAYSKIDFSTTKAALVTVVSIQGSSYRRTGARMLVLDNGIYFGGISGGCLEGDALRRAQKAIFKSKPSIVTYDTSQDDGHEIGVGLGCNGIIDVLITPLNNNDKDPVYLLSVISEAREPAVLVTIIGCLETSDIFGQTILFETEEQFISLFAIKDIGVLVLKDIKQALANKNSETINYDTATGTIRIFIEVIMPSLNLIIYGSNYDILPAASIGRQLGWNVTVVMNIAKANKVLIETATSIIDNKSNQQPVIDSYTAVVLMAHDYKTDLDNLKKILPTKASYIGLLGPRKRSEKMFSELPKENIGLSGYSMDRIYAPCGLDIGASNSEEIALSIAAEIRAHFAKRQGMSLKFRKGTIYNN